MIRLRRRTEGKAATGREKKSLKGAVYLDGSEKPPEVCKKEEKGEKGKAPGTPRKIYRRAFYEV